tara:strand:+ start:279 stop:467 length:189 start_codon:yes stop_codon:yes gene_type:complete
MKTFKQFMEQMTAPLSGDMLKQKQAGVKTPLDIRSVEQKMKSLKSLGRAVKPGNRAMYPWSE